MPYSLRFQLSHPLLSLVFFSTLAYAISMPAAAQTSPSMAGQEDARPLSPAQVALFETPHLDNITHPETLRYTYSRFGPASFNDTVAAHIQIETDGTKDLTFDYFTGPRRVMFPGVDHFRGNPLIMLVLDRDVAAMKDAIGMSASYFRDRIRESFVEAANVSAVTTEFEGVATPARLITVQPFAHEARLERIASLQAKRYSFVLADAVPGMIAEIRIDTPEDAALHAPAMSERIIFTGVEP